MIISPSQQLVFDTLKNERVNIAVQASAGAGKTTTLLESLKFIPKFKKTVFLSFSNAIVNELKEKVPSNIKSSTLHSLGCRMITAKYKGLKIEENKYFKLALEKFPEKNKETYKKAYGVQDLCNYARLTFSDYSENSLQQLCDKYLLDCDSEQILIASFILSENTRLQKLRVIDFSDMIFLPAKYSELITEVFDYVAVDEVQDLNKAQAQFVENILRKPSGRIIMVGDFRQAIYSFTGSDIDSFQQLEKRFNSKRLALTVTYRCARKIVELAQSVYPDDIQAWEDSPDGIVRRGELMEATQGDMVICRNTRPLVDAFFDFISNGKKAYIVGKDYERGLVNLANSVAAYSKEKVQENLENKLEVMLQDLIQNKVYNPENNPKYMALQEKCSIISLILEKIDKAMDLVKTIEEIFHEDKKGIKLLTAHRSKGMESERVFFIEVYKNEKLLPSKYAVLDYQLQQENNLLFVVYTRAKREFIFVSYEGN